MTITMNSENNLKTHVLACDIKDPNGLNDFQKIPDRQGIAIPQVGISRFRLPLNVKRKDGSESQHDCTASMFVNLKAGKTGINMSRLCAILQEEGLSRPVDGKFFFQVLSRYKSELKDYPTEDDLEEASLSLKFNFPLKQKSLKSGNWGWQYYPTKLEARMNCDNNFTFYITTEYEYSSTCPCSLSMAKQYESDFAQGKTSEGNGIGVAHGQRSRAICKVKVNRESDFVMEDLIDLLRKAIPTETQSLVKRVDEQAFAILNGSNPMFVEHASKSVYKTLNADKRICDWVVSFEHFESLHSHNAVAVISKGVQDGLSVEGFLKD